MSAEIQLKWGELPCLVPESHMLTRYWSALSESLTDIDRVITPPAIREFYQQTPFSTINWPPVPRAMGFNQLYWPSGATRIAHIWILFDRSVARYEQDLTITLVDLDGAVDVEVILPMTAVRRVEFGMDGQYLQALELVDPRFWIQGASWVYDDEYYLSEYVDSINAQLAAAGSGIDLSVLTGNGGGSPRSPFLERTNYGLDRDEFARRDLSIPQVIDALAAANGQVPVFTILPPRAGGHGRFLFSTPNFLDTNLFGRGGRLISTGDIITVASVRFGVEYQFRKQTHWHRDNREPHKVVVGAEPPSAIIKVSGFWSDTQEAAFSSAFANSFANIWHNLWFGETNSYNTQSIAGLFPKNSGGLSVNLLDFRRRGAADEHGTASHGGGDHLLFTISPDDASVRMVGLPTLTYPKSILVENFQNFTLENIIIKTPPDGIPAASGSGTVAPTTCVVYELNASNRMVPRSNPWDLPNNLTASVYSVGAAVPGDIFAVATLMDDGTYAVGASGGGGTAGTLFARINGCLLPGQTECATIMEWDGSEFVESGEDNVTVGDSAFQTCALDGEIVQVYWSTEHERYEVLGSSGLRRYAVVETPVIPGRSDGYLGGSWPIYEDFAQGSLIDWDDSRELDDKWVYALRPSASLGVLSAAANIDAEDVVYEVFTPDTDGEYIIKDMDDVPDNFGRIACYLSFKVVARASGRVDDLYGLSIWIKTASGLVLAANDVTGTPQVAATNLTSAPATFGPTNFNYINTNATRDDWLAAQVVIVQNHTAVGAGDGGRVEVDYVELTGRYTPSGKESIVIFDPTLHSVVMPGEIVPIHYHSKLDDWVVEPGFGCVRRALLMPPVQAGSNEWLAPGEVGQYRLTDPDSPFTEIADRRNYTIDVVNRIHRAIRIGAWCTVQWKPWLGDRIGSGPGVNQRYGEWEVVFDHSELMDVMLDPVPDPQGQGATSHKYHILDALSGELLDGGPDGQGVDPTAEPHQWVRMQNVDYETADFGTAWYNGAGPDGEEQLFPRPDAYQLRWINENPMTIERCVEPPEPPTGGGAGYYCVQIQPWEPYQCLPYNSYQEARQAAFDVRNVNPYQTVEACNLNCYPGGTPNQSPPPDPLDPIPPG